MRLSEVKSYCDQAYERYHHQKYVSPDPLELVLPFDRIADREIAGFISAALALGRVGGIIRAAGWVLEQMGSPYECLITSTDQELASLATPFQYRFFDGSQLAGLLSGLKAVVTQFGSIQACLASGMEQESAPRNPGSSSLSRTTATEPALRGLTYLADHLVAAAGGRLDKSILIPRPERGSASKRLFLFLRWMVRNDDVDPGGWSALKPEQLMVPVDTHMLTVCRSLGLTAARQPTLSVSREITGAFRRIEPSDPVKYDFSLTRLGIHPEAIRERKSRR